MTIFAREFSISPDYFLSMPYFLMLRMLEENNYLNMSIRKNSETKKKGKGLSLAEMKKGIQGGVQFK